MEVRKSLFLSSFQKCFCGVLERVSMLVGDSPYVYIPKTLFYVELATYVTSEQRKAY